MKATLQDLLASGKPIIADGAMGSNLMELGLEVGMPTGVWNVEQPDKVRQVHRAFIEAGANIILTNTFVCNRLSLRLYKLEDRADELTRAAVQNARAEAEAAAGPVMVGGSIGPSGGILQPLGDLTFEEARDAFEQQARVMSAGGVDVFWIETMSDLEEVRAAVEGCRRADPDMPIVTTMSFDRGGRTMMGTTPEQAAETLTGFGVQAIGANCGSGLDDIREVIAKLHAAAPDTVLIAKANAGLPRVEGDLTVYDATPHEMGDYARDVRAGGAMIVGACCGSTPEHLRAIVQALNAQ